MGKKNIILLIVGLLVTAGIVIACIALLAKPEEEESEPSAIKLTQISTDDVVSMKITEGDKTVDLVKKDGKWSYREDGQMSLDQSNTEAACTMVCFLYVREKLFDSVSDKSVYGLVPPALSVEIETKDGSKKTFDFGTYTSDRKNIFMHYSDDDAVYLYDLDSFSILKRAADAMQDLTMDIDIDNVVRIEFMRETGDAVPVIMNKIDEDKRVAKETWLLESPFTAVANGQAVSLVQAFFDIPRYMAYAGDEPLPEQGFDSSQAYIDLIEEDGTHIHLTLGGKTESGRYYCIEEGRKGVYELAAGFDSVLGMEDWNLIPGTVLPCDYENPANFTIKTANSTHFLTCLPKTMVKDEKSHYNIDYKSVPDESAKVAFEYISQLSFEGIAEDGDLGSTAISILLEKNGNSLEFDFHPYRNEFYSVELNKSGNVSGYVKAENMAILAKAMDELAM